MPPGWSKEGRLSSVPPNPRNPWDPLDPPPGQENRPPHPRPVPEPRAVGAGVLVLSVAAVLLWRRRRMLPKN